MESITTYKQICLKCKVPKIALSNFPLTHFKTLEGSDLAFYASRRGWPALFGDECFACTPLKKSLRTGSFLERPPTFEEMPAFYHSKSESIKFPTRYWTKFTDLREEQKELPGDIPTCRICHSTQSAPNPNKGPGRFRKALLIRRSNIWLCRRCFEAFPTTVQSEASRYDKTPFYPYQGIFRRIGPYTWDDKEDILMTLMNSFCDFTDERQDPKWGVYALSVWRSFFSQSVLESRSNMPLILAGHRMYKKGVHTQIPNFSEFLQETDPHRNRSSSARSQYLVPRYLLGDAFPYPDPCYELIHYALLNRAYWGTTFTDGPYSLSTVKRLGVLLSPRILPVKTLHYINLRIAYNAFGHVPENSDLRTKYQLAAIKAKINTALTGSMDKNDRRPDVGHFGYLAHDFRVPLRYIAEGRFNQEAISYDWIASFLASNIQSNVTDEWWRMIYFTEALFWIHVLEAESKWDQSNPPNLLEIWSDTVEKIWNLAISNMNEEYNQFLNDSFSFRGREIKQDEKIEETEEKLDEGAVLHKFGDI